VSHHLVTGGAGFIGSALANRLVREGHDVTVFDRFSRGKAERLVAEVRQVRGDIQDGPAVRHALRGQDVVWHLAYVQGTQTFYADPKDVIDVALKGIMNVLGGCAQRTTPPEFVLMSSSEAYQVPPDGMFPTDETVPLSVPDVTNPRYSYGGGKIASEIATLAYSQAGALGRSMIVRAHNVYGPDMGYEHVIPEFAVRMLNLGDAHQRTRWPFPIQGTGYETRSFCFIDDCVDGLMILLRDGQDRNVYHLGNPQEEYRISAVAELVADRYRRRVRVVPGKLPEGSPPRRAPDITKMRTLGFAPTWTLPQGLEPTLDWYRAHRRQTAAA
jgi:nucleoside-diphosphate-sugar epimerase